MTIIWTRQLPAGLRLEIVTSLVSLLTGCYKWCCLVTKISFYSPLISQASLDKRKHELYDEADQYCFEGKCKLDANDQFSFIFSLLVNADRRFQIFLCSQCECDFIILMIWLCWIQFDVEQETLSETRDTTQFSIETFWRQRISSVDHYHLTYHEN